MGPGPTIADIVPIPLGRAGLPPALSIEQPPTEPIRQQTQALPAATTGHAQLLTAASDFSSTILLPAAAGGLLTHFRISPTTTATPPSYGWLLVAASTPPASAAQALNATWTFPQFRSTDDLARFAGLPDPDSSLTLFPNALVPPGSTGLYLCLNSTSATIKRVLCWATLISPAP